MSETVIRVNGLGKMYRIGTAREKSDGLRHSLEAGLRRVGQRLWGRSVPTPTAEDFWALKDVSFEVKRGECVGVIGRNGAGKSTLLKVLSRITEPTAGEVGMRGRVGSLLEVGTGFHVELSGRENIFLNGAILGMGRKEIARKFDEIVAFSEVEKFLDTPVKYYSSGMYMRLAFSVAAHLEPEILIVDEVLAVGDTEFQKKCLGKMDETTKGGRTILFVSHNLATIRSLCTTCCVMAKGQLVFQGDPSKGVDLFLHQAGPTGTLTSRNFSPPKSDAPWMRSATLTSSGSPADTIRLGDELTVVVQFASTRPIRYPKLGVIITDEEGHRLVGASNRYQSNEGLSTPATEGTIECQLGVVPLMPGRHWISLWFGDVSHDSHREEATLTFDVVDHDAWGYGKTATHVFHGRDGASLWWPARYSLTLCDNANAKKGC